MPMLTHQHSSFNTHSFRMTSKNKIDLSDRVNEFNYGVPLIARQFPELLHALAGIALFISVPHDSLYDIARTAVMQTVFMSGTERRQSPAPKRSRATPARADIIDHVQPVLYQVAIRPYLLMGIPRQPTVAIREEQIRIGEIIIACGP